MKQVINHIKGGGLLNLNRPLIYDLAGSDFDPLMLQDIILFMEDTDEGMSKVDRMLHNMEMRGLLSNVRGITVGQFNKYKHPENGFDDMYAMLHEYLQHYDIPICYDFPVCYAHLRNSPLLTGAKATLEVSPNGVTLRY